MYFLEHAIQKLFTFSLLAHTLNDQPFTSTLGLLLLVETEAKISIGSKWQLRFSVQKGMFWLCGSWELNVCSPVKMRRLL